MAQSPPDNDPVCAAIPLETNGSCNSTGATCINDCFTTEYANPDDSPDAGGVVPECIPFINNTVWFTMQLSDPNNVGFEIMLSGGTAQNLGLIIGTFNECTGQFDPEVFFCGAGTDPIEFDPVDDAETYYIIVSTTEADAGTFTICIDEIPPCFDNNFCEDPMGNSSANDMGVLVTLSPDGTGNCTVAGDPFNCVQGCNLFADVIEENVNCLGQNYDPVVWYSFTTDANAGLANIVLTSDEFDAPAFQLFLSNDGTCSDLTPIGICTKGSGGESTLTGLGVGAGQLYFIAIGGILTVGGEFEFCISILEDANSCTLDADVTITGRSNGGPLEGPFFPGETLSLCMNVSTFSPDSNCQWLQGVVPTFGNGWDPSSFDGNGMPLNVTLNGSTIPAPGISGGTTWDWFSDVTYHHNNCFFNVGDFDGNGTLDICNALYNEDCVGPGLTGGATGPCWQDIPGNVLPPGWFAYGIQGLCAIPGHPSVDFGDGFTCDATMGPWQFCFDLTVRPFPDCQADQTTSDLSLGFVTFSDGEVGSWVGGPSICANDEPLNVRLSGCCVELEYVIVEHEPIYSGGLFTWLVEHPYADFWIWTVEAGAVTGANNGEGPNLSLILDNLVNEGFSAETVTYRLLGFDGGECPAVLWEIAVEVLPLLTASFTVADVQCFGGNDGSITIDSLLNFPGDTINPNTIASINYDWDWLEMVGNEDYGGSGPYNDTKDIGNLVAGTYSVLVTAIITLGLDTIFEQTIDSTLTVDQPDSLILTVQVDSTECSNTNAAIDLMISGGTPAYIYNWSGGLGNEEDPDSVPAGAYAVSVTDQNGCTESLSVIVENYSPIEGSISYVPQCSGDTTTLVLSVMGGTEPYTFDWDNDGTGDNDDSQNLSVTNAGTYSVTVYDAVLCRTTISITIIHLPFLAQTVIANFCSGDSVHVNGTWYSNVGLYADTIPSSTVGCDTLLTTVILEEPLVTSNVAASFCHGDSVQLYGKWYKEVGSYIDTLSAELGCDTLLVFTITEIPIIVVTIDTSFCAGDSVFIGSKWYSSAGTYNDTLTASSGCDSVVMFSIYETALQTTSVDLTICLGDSIEFNGTWYSMPGNYTTYLRGLMTCDTLTTLNVLGEDCNPLDDNYVVIDSADFIIKSVSKGLILRSADGQCWKLSVNVFGIIEVVNVQCLD